MSNPIEIKIADPLNIQDPAEPGEPLVKVNGQIISDASIAQEMQYHPADSKEQAYHQASRALVIQEILCQRADELFAEHPEKLALDKENKIESLLDQEVEIPTPSTEELQRYYEANTLKFKTDDLLEVSHILLDVPPDEIAMRHEVKKEAYVLIEKLNKHPKQFSKMAKSYSSCPSKETGGSLGQIGKGQTVLEFEKALQTLPEGLSPHPIESRYGFHIVRIDRKVEGKQLPFEMVKDRIHQYLYTQVQRRAISQYISLLLAEADIEGIDLDTPSSPLVQ